MEIMSPTEFRKNLFATIKKVNEDSEPVIIHGKDESSSAVLISKKDWDSIAETLLLEQTGVMDKVRKREKDHTGFTDIEDIDWNEL